jgi:hypothetical protein
MSNMCVYIYKVEVVFVIPLALFIPRSPPLIWMLFR